ncbi:hypothetical protein EVA_16126, partial [gut metagenome]
AQRAVKIAMKGLAPKPKKPVEADGLKIDSEPAKA